MKPRTIRELMVSFMEDYVKGSSEAVILVEDGVATPDDPFLAKMETPRVWTSADATVYWYADRDTGVEHLLRWAWDFWSLFVFTSLSGPMRLSPRLTLTTVELDVFAGQIQHLAVPAFDFEGFVVWTR
jgi:hypothetical protein